MVLPLPAWSDIQAILFDVNGTLRVRQPHAPTQQAASARLFELLGKAGVFDPDWEEMASRYKSYTSWAQERLVQLTEEEVWTRWILQEGPPEKISPLAADLTLAWSERNGRQLPRPEAEAAIIELKQRDYRLGIISNSLSTLDIPNFLETYGWDEYFDVVILSSNLKIRKPAPEPFLDAAHALDLPPGSCAYVGNNLSRDMAGCKQAGFSLGILLASSTKSGHPGEDPDIQPDIVIRSLGELLDLFPIRR